MEESRPAVTKITLQRRVPWQALDFIATGKQECDAMASYGPSARAYEMIHFVLKGKAHFYFDNQHFLVVSGQCFYVPAYANTFYHADAIEPCTYAWIDFAGSEAEKMLESCGLSRSCPVLPLTNIKRVWELVGELLHCHTNAPGNDASIQGLMLQIFGVLQANQAVLGDQAGESPLDSDLVQRAVAYVQEHADEQLSVQQLADSLFISRGYLHQQLVRYLHITPRQFITNAKIEKATELLIKTLMPVSHIAQNCGYRNQFAFSRAFTRELSINPSEYRRRYSHPDRLVTE
ncbi:MAG: AraC family transcriptional regulator [Bifidobacterium crudilactis]|jgi:AraC-like DNA-binding protein